MMRRFSNNNNNTTNHTNDGSEEEEEEEEESKVASKKRRFVALVVTVAATVFSTALLIWHRARRRHQHPLGHGHYWGGRQRQDDDMVSPLVLLCEPSDDARREKFAAIHDVDGEARCTADAGVPLHLKAWARTVVDAAAGWVALRSLATGRYLVVDGSDEDTMGLASAPRCATEAISSHTSSEANAQIKRKATAHWRFRPAGVVRRDSTGGRSGQLRWYRLESRALRGAEVATTDEPSKPGTVRASRRAPHQNSQRSLVAAVPATPDDLRESRTAFERLARDEDARVRRELDAAKRIFLATSDRNTRVVSMGLYGSKPKYVRGAVRNAELLEAYFPSWTLRIYADDSVPRSALRELAAKGADVRLMKKKRHENPVLTPHNAAGMFWRFHVADDTQVERFIVRDADSRLNARDACAVAEWIQSGKPVHSVRDHPNHDRPLNGGMWGATNASNIAGKIRALSRAFDDHDSYGADLAFLEHRVYPLIADEIYAHDAYTCHKHPGSVPFPTKRRRDFQHVGQVFDEFDRPRMDDIDSFTRGLDAPLACRGAPDWIYG